LYSECALIFRRRLLEKDPASPNLASRRSDGRLSSYQEFVGRGVLVKASLSLEAQRFVEKDFRFCADFEEGIWLFGSMIDRGYKSNVWVTAEDMLVIIARYRHELEWAIAGVLKRTLSSGIATGTRRLL
jgi:hypothetical protein